MTIRAPVALSVEVCELENSRDADETEVCIRAVCDVRCVLDCVVCAVCGLTAVSGGND